LVLAAGAAGLAGCGGGGNQSATGSGGSNACQTIDCLGPASLSPTWVFEIDPPGSSSAAIAFRAAPASGTGLTLTADSQSTVTATFSGPTNVAAPSSATAIVTYPSPLTGGPALTVQAPTVPVPSSTTDVTATLTVPSLWLSSSASTATLTLVPLPPSDQQTPPYVIPGVTLQSTFTKSVGGETPGGDSNFTISGQLQSSNALPAAGFVARAFQGGAQVSSAPQTKAVDGSFQLVLPSAVLAVNEDLQIQLTPQSDGVPWFVATPIAASTPSPFPTPIMLASYGDLTTVTFQLNDLDSQPVPGALVQAQTKLGSNAYGQTVFSRSAVSSDTGSVALALLPDTTLRYDVVVVPPPGAPGATTCLQAIDLEGGSGALVSHYRTEVTGQIQDAAGSGVANVSIRATPGPGPTWMCASTPAAAGSTTTDANGNYTLLLDQGTYQFDYDPPAGSAVPRFTDSVTVDIASSPMPTTPHSVTLPAAGAVTGTVLDASGKALPSATVRLYDPQCAAPCVPPLLRGQAVTDSTGAFRFAAAPPN
jgi:hypothetical protein